MNNANDSSFNEQIHRIKLVTKTYTYIELAKFLGVPTHAISNARRRGSIPAEWLLTLMQKTQTNPDWILTGNHPRILATHTELYTNSAETAQYVEERETVRRLPSQLLADELLRRIAVGEGR